MELRRNDEVFLNALGARRIPDPITAGDFCRRFHAEDVITLIDLFNEVRQRVWARQPASFFAQASIDLDGTLVPTQGECKAGMDIANSVMEPLGVILPIWLASFSVNQRLPSRPAVIACGLAR
jgi:hypothetical protein